MMIIFIAVLIELSYTTTMLSTLLMISYLELALIPFYFHQWQKCVVCRRLTKSKLQHNVVGVVDVVVLQDLTDWEVALVVAAGLTVLLWLVFWWFIPHGSCYCAPPPSPSRSSDTTATLTTSPTPPVLHNFTNLHMTMGPPNSP